MVEVKEQRHRHVPDRRRLLLLRELHPHRPDLRRTTSSAGARRSRCRSSGRRSASSGRSSSSSPTSSTRAGRSPSTCTRPRAYYTTFTRRAIGGSMTWGYELSGLAPWWSFAQAARGHAALRDLHERAGGRDRRRATDLLYANQFKSGTTSSVRLSLQWDKRDNRLFPTNGFFLSARAEAAPPVPRAGRALRQGREPLHALRGRRPLRTGRCSCGLVARGEAHARLHPRLGRRPPGADLRALLRRRHQLGPRLPLPLHRARRCTSAARTTRLRAARPLTVGGDKQVVLNFELEFPLLREGRASAASCSATSATRSRRGEYSDPAVPLSLYKSVGLRAALVQPDRPAPLRVGLPAQPPQGPADRQLHRPAPRLPVHDRQLLLIARRRSTACDTLLAVPRPRPRARAAAARPRRAEDRLRRPPARPQRGRRGQGREGPPEARLRREAEAARRKKIEFDKLQADFEKQAVVHGRRRRSKDKAGELDRKAHASCSSSSCSSRRTSPSASAR